MGVPEEQEAEGRKSQHPLAWRNVVIVSAALGAAATFGANWIFYTRTDGRLLEQRMASMERSSEKMAEHLNTLGGTINTVLIQQAKHGELLLKVTEAIERLDRRKE